MIDSPSPLPHARVQPPAVQRPAVHIDCHTCTARPVACGDCVVSFLLGGPPAEQGDLDSTEAAALAVLADSGLVPPLRLVHPNAE